MFKNTMFKNTAKLFLTSAIVTSAIAQPSNIEIKDQAKTRFGELKIVQNKENLNTAILFNNKNIAVSIDNFLDNNNILDIYQFNQQDIALISGFSGGSATNTYSCFLVVMDKNKAVAKEPENCIFAEDYNPKAAIKHDILTISLGYTNHQNHQIEFDGETAKIYDWKSIGKTMIDQHKCEMIYDSRDDICDYFQGKNQSGFMIRIGANLEYDTDGFNKNNFDKLCINHKLSKIEYYDFSQLVCHSN